MLTWNPMSWVILGNPLADWAIALGFAVSINLAVALVRWLAINKLSNAARRSRTHFDDGIVEAVRRTRQWLVTIVSLYIGSRYLELPEKTNVFLGGAATLAAFMQVGMWISALLDFGINRYRRHAMETDTAALTSLAALTFIARTLIWAAILLLALDNLGVNVTAMVAGLGVGGIAVALAVQNILGDLFASLSIVIDKPFVVGDFIVNEDYMGTVENVGLKTTRLRSLGGEQLVFSNSDLLKSRLRNFKRMRERRVVFAFGLTYAATPEQIEQVTKAVTEIVKKEEKVRFDRAHFTKFGESSLDFEVVYIVLSDDYNTYMDIQQRINLAMMRAFADIGVEFAFPTRTVVVEKLPGAQAANDEGKADRPREAGRRDRDMMVAESPRPKPGRGERPGFLGRR
ncbi:MAG TPA: mechanosensitive ion channel family protein [Nevskiaceae bacterium]|nr:mechanosensitive ion channel family protein [Nevskiaceae bacterium]